MPGASPISADVVERLERHKELYVRTLRNTAQELESKIQELGLLGQLGLLFRSSTRLKDLACQALPMFLEASGARNASILLLSPKTRELTLLAALGQGDRRAAYFGREGHPLAPFRVGEGLAGCCVAEGKSIFAEDVTADPRFLAGIGKVSVGSLACLPLVVQDEPLGNLNLSHPDRRGLDGRRLPVWSILTSYLAIAVSHALLFRELKETNQKLEERVRQRTRRLETANRELRGARDEIARHNEDLQQRVRERTQELETAFTELRVQHASLEDANRVKDEFLTNINHELKTPLNAVLGYSGLLLKDPERRLSDGQRADLELIESNGKHLQNILDNILSLKEVESGSVEPDPAPTDLNGLLLATVASVKPRVQVKGLELVFEPLDVPPVTLDPTLVRRVVFNLLDNAVKFSQRGKITVRSRLVQTDPSRPGAESDGRSFALVEVEDQGRGVDAGDLERIFQKFQQVEPPRRKREGGSGVGLAIAKSLVELHGGRIWVTSRPGRGSVFAFSLPLEGPS